MRRILLYFVITVLAAGTVLNGYFYIQASNQIASLQVQLSVLQQGLNTTNDSITQTNDNVKQTNDNITQTNDNVTNLGKQLAGVEGRLTSIQQIIEASPERDVPGMIEKTLPSLVRINVTGAGFEASGSGSIIDERGYIVTNQHVIDEALTMTVVLADNTAMAATLTGFDATQDLAIIKLNSSRTDFPVITRGDIEDIVVGDEVIAIGFPLGTDLPGPATVTMGVISALRERGGVTYVQTDATINPGNSGGALMTLDGKMIGVPTSIVIGAPREDIEHINMCIPIDQVNAIIATFVR